jgi:hypothetical protein
MKRYIVFHPILFSLYPIIALISFNIDQILPQEVLHSLFFTLVGAIGLFLILKILVKDWKRAGLVCSLWLILFFSFGHIYGLIAGKSIANIPLGRADYLASLWAIVFIMGTWFILRKLRNTLGVTNFLNLVSIILMIFPGYRILSFALHNNGQSMARVSQSNAQEYVTIDKRAGSSPDIYYLIVDGYARADVLKEIYSYDNSEFINFLTEKGFYIADDSHSNYAQTSLSLGSSLNLDYINELSNEMGKNSTSRIPLVTMIQHSKVRDYLSSRGYQLVTIASTYSVTEIRDADLFLNPGEKLNRFESTLLSGSVAVLVLDKLIPAWYRNQLLMNLDTLANLPAVDSPKFVFAHLTLPHPPFVFGPNGENIPPRNFKEGNYYDGTPQEYIEGYRGQLIYLNKHLEQIITNILNDSDPEPIILLQADHGPGALLNWDFINKTCLKERMSILNAYYLPGNFKVRLYPSITPVNSFRIVFDAYFNA